MKLQVLNYLPVDYHWEFNGKMGLKRDYYKGETVAAVATPPGEGGVAIIRISGENALEVAQKISSLPVAKWESHRAYFGKVIGAKGEVIDEVLFLPMLGRRSYTGEDTVEVHCHGGRIVTKQVLERVLASGAKAALPGEFTYKAFINKKLDLSAAEAVQELICAKNDYAVHLAGQQLQGALHHHVTGLQKKLTDIAAILEAWVDFPEEGLEFASFEDVIGSLKSALNQIETLLSTFHDGKIATDGIALCLIGPPNVGKSSLMNALLKKERAIVTPIAGTTRDTLTEEMRIGGLNFSLTDTAGIRTNAGVVEQEGIRRAKKAMEESDLILLVLDASKKVAEEELSLLATAPKEKSILIWNKTDISSAPLPDWEGNRIAISALSGEGIDALKALFDQIIWEKGPPAKEEVLITSLRHKEALENAMTHLQNVIHGLQTGISAEFVTSDMRAALHDLSSIIGTDVTEDLLNAIFSKFCVGK